MKPGRTALLEASPPARALDCILEDNAAAQQLITNLVSTGVIPGPAGLLPLRDQLLHLTVEAALIVGDEAQHPVCTV